MTGIFYVCISKWGSENNNFNTSTVFRGAYHILTSGWVQLVQSYLNSYKNPTQVWDTCYVFWLNPIQREILCFQCPYSYKAEQNVFAYQMLNPVLVKTGIASFYQRDFLGLMCLFLFFFLESTAYLNISRLTLKFICDPSLPIYVI